MHLGARIVCKNSFLQGLTGLSIENRSGHFVVIQAVSAQVRNPYENPGKNVQTKIFQGRFAACHVSRGLENLGKLNRW